MTNRFKNLIKRPIGSFVIDAFSKSELKQLGIVVRGGLYILPYKFRDINVTQDGRVVTLQPCNLSHDLKEDYIYEGFKIINKTIISL